MHALVIIVTLVAATCGITLDWCERRWPDATARVLDRVLRVFNL